ncbi:MAG: type III secretion system cytoplasmic ring protein SctQ [Thermodesulforhabdaceae bacterium]
MKVLTFEKINARDVDGWNKICCGHFRFSWLGEVFRLRLYPAPETNMKSPLWTLNVGSSEALGSFYFSERLIKKHIASTLGKKEEEITFIPDEVREIAVEVIGEELLEKGGKVLGLEFSRRQTLTAQGDEPKKIPYYRLRVEMISEREGDVTGEGKFLLDPQGFHEIASRLSRLPREKTYFTRSIPFFVRFVVGETILPLEELKNLEVGDVIFVERDYGIGNGRLLIVSEGNLFWGEYGDDGKIVVVKKKELVMSDEEKSKEVKPEQISLRDVEVEVQFSVGRKTMTLEELENIGEGYIFTLETPLSRIVTILVNRRPVGFGELVEVDGRVGVRVTELNSNLSKE